MSKNAESGTIAAEQSEPKQTATLQATSPAACGQASAGKQTLPLKETFSREYVAELRAENETWQQKHRKTSEALDKLKAQTHESLSQTQQATRERIVRAEMKALALKAGLRDLDCLKLLDMSAITLKADDTLEGAAAALASLKAAKPFLFAEPAVHSSAPETPPTPKDAQPTDVSQLPPDDYARRKAAYLRTALQKTL